MWRVHRDCRGRAIGARPELTPVQPFDFLTVQSEDAAQHAAAATDARYLAGGTTLVDLMKLHVEHPAVVVDINPLPLTRIEQLRDGSVRVGALVRNSDM